MLGGATAVALALGMWAAPAAAAADTQVTVTQNTAGTITLSRASAPANAYVAFTMNSSYRHTDLQIVQLRNGVTWQQFYTKAAERDVLATAAAAQQWLIANVSFLGGLTDMDAEYGGGNYPDTVKFRKVMPVGTYYIVQMRQVGGVQPAAQAFTISGSGGTTSPYSPQSWRVNNLHGPDKFFATNINGSNRMIATTVKNQAGSGWVQPPQPQPTRELHDTHLIEVQPGTTEADVTSWITAGGPSPLVANGGRFNFGILSPSGYADVEIKPRDVNGNPKPGLYVYTSRQRDANTGQRHFDEGEFLLVSIAA